MGTVEGRASTIGKLLEREGLAFDAKMTSWTWTFVHSNNDIHPRPSSYLSNLLSAYMGLGFPKQFFDVAIDAHISGSQSWLAGNTDAVQIQC